MSRAFRYIQHAGDLENVASNVTGTFKIPLGGTHYRTIMRILNSSGGAVTVANIKSEINAVRIRIDGTTIVDVTPTVLFMLEAFYGETNTDGFLPIEWARNILQTNEEASVYALGTADVRSWVLEVDFGSLTNVAKVEVWTDVTNEARKMGQHRRIQKFPQSFGTTGEQEIATLPLEGANTGYLALHIGHGSGTPDKVNVRYNGVNVYDEVPRALNTDLLEHSKREQQSNFFSVCFDTANILASFLPMAGAQQFRQTIYWSGAPSGYNIWAEKVHGLATGNNEG